MHGTITSKHAWENSKGEYLKLVSPWNYIIRGLPKR